MTDLTGIAARKAAARLECLARRAARSAEERDRAEAALLTRARRCTADVVAAYVPVRGEPGSMAALDELGRRATVLLPITGPAGAPLQWATYRGRETLVRGPMGLLQPAQPDGSRLADAEVVLVPALAIGRDGTRLGRGGGFYDRTLVEVARERLCGVVYDDEVVDTLPVEDHDIRVGRLCTPSFSARLSV